MSGYGPSGKEFQCDVPDGWSIDPDDEQLSFADPADTCAITISLYPRKSLAGHVAANKHLRRYLSDASIASAQILVDEAGEAVASYRGRDRRIWFVKFLENDSYLLMATLNSSEDVRRDTLINAANSFNTISLTSSTRQL